MGRMRVTIGHTALTSFTALHAKVNGCRSYHVQTMPQILFREVVQRGSIEDRFDWPPITFFYCCGECCVLGEGGGRLTTHLGSKPCLKGEAHIRFVYKDPPRRR